MTSRRKKTDDSLYQPAEDWDNFGKLREEAKKYTLKPEDLKPDKNSLLNQDKTLQRTDDQQSFHTAFESEHDLSKPLPPPPPPPRTITMNKEQPQSQQSLQSIGSQSSLFTIEEEPEHSEVAKHPLGPIKYNYWVHYWRKHGGKDGKPILHPGCQVPVFTEIPSELICNKGVKESKQYQCRLWKGVKDCPYYKSTEMDEHGKPKEAIYMAASEYPVYTKTHGKTKEYKNLEIIQNLICDYQRECEGEVKSAYADNYGVYAMNDADLYGQQQVYGEIGLGHHALVDIYGLMLVMVSVICFVSCLCCGVISGWIWCQHMIHRQKRDKERVDMSQMTRM